MSKTYRKQKTGRRDNNRKVRRQENRRTRGRGRAALRDALREYR